MYAQFAWTMYVVVCPYLFSRSRSIGKFPMNRFRTNDLVTTNPMEFLWNDLFFRILEEFYKRLNLMEFFLCVTLSLIEFLCF